MVIETLQDDLLKAVITSNENILETERQMKFGAAAFWGRAAPFLQRQWCVGSGAGVGGGAAGAGGPVIKTWVSAQHNIKNV